MTAPPLTGGSPRELNEAVGTADWAPDGQSLALARLSGNAVVLEYPQGKTLYETQGWVDDLRISPDGNRVAFIDHPIRWDSLGTIMVVDRQGKRQQLTGSFSDVRGLAWGPSGNEIWFTGSTVHLSGNLYAVDLQGHQRLVWAGAGGAVLQVPSTWFIALVQMPVQHSPSFEHASPGWVQKEDGWQTPP